MSSRAGVPLNIMKQIMIDYWCECCGLRTTIDEVLSHKSCCCGVDSVLGEDRVVIPDMFPLFTAIEERAQVKIKWDWEE